MGAFLMPSSGMGFVSDLLGLGNHRRQPSRRRLPTKFDFFRKSYILRNTDYKKIIKSPEWKKYCEVRGKPVEFQGESADGQNPTYNKKAFPAVKTKWLKKIKAATDKLVMSFPIGETEYK